MFWWWDRLDRCDVYSHYRPLSRFLADVPWTSGEVRPAAATCSEPRVRPVALQARDRAWVWLFDRHSSWQKSVVEARSPTPIRDAVLQLNELPPGVYHVEWFDTRDGNTIARQTSLLENSGPKMQVPDFTRDLACSIERRQ